MARSAMTSQVIRLIRAAGCKDSRLMTAEEIRKSTREEYRSFENAQTYTEAEFFPKAESPEKPAKSRRKSAIGGELRLPEAKNANPALKTNSAEAVMPFIRESGKPLAVNLVSELINESLGEICRRFNVCTCDKCLFMITKKAEQELPVRFVLVESDSDCEIVTKALAELRPTVVRVLTRLVMAGKAKPYHNI